MMKGGRAAGVCLLVYVLAFVRADDVAPDQYAGVATAEPEGKVWRKCVLLAMSFSRACVVQGVPIDMSTCMQAYFFEPFRTDWKKDWVSSADCKLSCNSSLRALCAHDIFTLQCVGNHEFAEIYGLYISCYSIYRGSFLLTCVGFEWRMSGHKHAPAPLGLAIGSTWARVLMLVFSLIILTKTLLQRGSTASGHWHKTTLRCPVTLESKWTAQVRSFYKKDIEDACVLSQKCLSVYPTLCEIPVM